MNRSFPSRTLAAFLACAASTALAQENPAAPASGNATTVYRQVLPDGRIIYSDKPVKGGKIDHTITVEPPIKGNLWTTETGAKPVAPPRDERTPVRKVNAPPSGKKKTFEEATSDVIRAEMLLEDAKKRQEAGVEPLPGERTGTASGASRLNAAYEARQKALAKDAEEAEAALRQAVAERDALRNVR